MNEQDYDEDSEEDFGGEGSDDEDQAVEGQTPVAQPECKQQ